MTSSGYLSETWFDPRLEVRLSSIHAKGLFATDLIRNGEVVMIWGGTLYSQEDMQNGRIPAELACSVTESGLLLCGRDDLMDRYINHACEPNIWMVGDTTLVARRDIQVGDEITGDYAVWDMTTIIDPCRCRSPLCRGRITGDDWRIPELQVRYRGHFLPYIAQCIADQSTATK